MPITGDGSKDKTFRTMRIIENTINPKTLRWYFEWCDQVFSSRLQPGQFILIGVSFLVNDPPKFLYWLRKEIKKMTLRNIMVRPLEAMKKIEEEDLKEFFDLNDIPLLFDRRDKVIEAILSKTGGSYDRTVSELRKWLECGLKTEEEISEDDDDFIPIMV